MEASTANLHVVEAAPGTGKSLLLVTNAKLLGALKCLNLVYNNTTASDLRGRGAINTHTFNSILMRSLRNSVVRQLYRQGGARKRTAPGTGEDNSRPSLGLVSGQDMNKTQLLLAMMYPPAAEDGNARFSLIYRLFGEFTKELYAAALNRGWANRFRAGFPEMTDVMALMALARELNLEERITKSFGQLTVAEQTRAAAMGNGPEQRLATGCSFIASIHDASLTTLTSEEWRIPTTGQTVRHLSLAGAPLIYPLPACSFEEQVVGRLHVPTLGSSLFGFYDVIQIDEVQDLTPAKALAALQMKEDSDRNGGPRHKTKLRIVGDSDQSVNGYVGSFIDGVAGVRAFLVKHGGAGLANVYDSTLTFSLRCSKTIVEYANQCLNGAFTNYAKDAVPGRSPTKPFMKALPDAKEGKVVHQATFCTHPIEDVLDLSPSNKVAVIGRRYLELITCYHLRAAEGKPCQLYTNGARRAQRRRALLHQPRSAQH